MAAIASAVQHLLRITALNTAPAAYAPILRLQEMLFEQRMRGLIPDTLLQLEVSTLYSMPCAPGPLSICRAVCTRGALLRSTSPLESIQTPKLLARAFPVP